MRRCWATWTPACSTTTPASRSSGPPIASATSSRHWLEGLPETRRRGGLHARPRQPARSPLGVPLHGATRAAQLQPLRDALRHRRPHPRAARVPGRRWPHRGHRAARPVADRARRAPLHPQPGRCRPATRRRPARLRHGPGHRGDQPWSGCASHTPSSGCRRGCVGPACRLGLRSACPTASDSEGRHGRWYPSRSCPRPPQHPSIVAPCLASTAVPLTPWSSRPALQLSSRRHGAGRPPRGGGRLAPRPR